MLAAALLAAAATSYQVVDSDSTAGFSLGATLHTVHGSGGRLSGSVTVEPAPDGSARLSGAIRLDAASLATGNGRRDRNMRENQLAVASYPTIEFDPEVLGPGKAAPDDPTAAVHSIRGRLTIRGVTRPVAVTVVLRRDGAAIRATGHIPVRLADFAIPDPSSFLLRVDDTVDASFDVRFGPEDGAR